MKNNAKSMQTLDSSLGKDDFDKVSEAQNVCQIFEWLCEYSTENAGNGMH